MILFKVSEEIGSGNDIRYWSWNSNTLATWCEELTHRKRPWWCERLKAGGEGDDRGWDGWVASPTQWTWVWVSSGSWWWTGRLGVLQSMELERVGHDWATELNWRYLALGVANEIFTRFCLFCSHDDWGNGLGVSRCDSLESSTPWVSGLQKKAGNKAAYTVGWKAVMHVCVLLL